MEKTPQSDKKTFILRDRNKSLSKNWYIEYKEGGKRVKKYGDINHGKTAKDRTERARKFMRELKKQFAQVPQSIDEKEKIYEALENERPFLRKKSYQTYKSKLDQFFEWLGDDPLSTDQLRRYLKLYRNTHSQQGTYDARRQMMTFFKKAGYEYLLQPIKIKKGQSEPLRYFQVHQCQELLEYLKKNDPMLHLHCLFIYYTAIRPRSELLFVRVDDIFHQERKVGIRGEHSKNHKTEFVRIAPKFYPYIEPYKMAKPGTYIFHAKGWELKPAGRNTYGRRFRQVLNHFGYDYNYQLYSWKHTGAIAVYKATKNIMALRDHCRHKEVSTTQLYLRQLGLDDYDDFYDGFPAPEEWG